MQTDQYTIIIPTRERADTLLYALKTCVTQDYDNLTILVSDNFSEDNTAEVVRSFGDPRVQYLNTGRRISMAHNWEFALSHVTDGFVTYLGDDDGLLPHAVRESHARLSETGLLAINMNPLTDFYLWPSYYKTAQANLLKVSFQNGYEIRDARKELGRLIQCRQEHSPMPGLYTSFIHLSAINKVRQISGNLFRSQIVDSYSAVALANAIGPYVYARRKLRLNGISSHSTGSSQFNYDANQKAADLFSSETPIPFHSRMIYSASYSYMIAENFLQSFDAGLNPAEKARFDFWPFINTALKEANTRLKGQYDTIVAATRYIAEANQLDTKRVEALIEQTHNRALNIIPYDLQRYTHPFLFFDAAAHGATNVFDAGALYHDIRQHPGKYMTKASTWGYMFNALFGELFSRYAPSDKKSGSDNRF